MAFSEPQAESFWEIGWLVGWLVVELLFFFFTPLPSCGFRLVTEECVIRGFAFCPKLTNSRGRVGTLHFPEEIYPHILFTLCP